MFNGGLTEDASVQVGLLQHHVLHVGSFYELKVKCNLIGSYSGSVRGFVGQFGLRTLRNTRVFTAFYVERLNLNEFGLNFLIYLKTHEFVFYSSARSF